MPSEWNEEEWNQEGVADAAAAVPADVAESMQQYVLELTTPATELEQQLLEATNRWAARHQPPGICAAKNPCLAGSSMSNSRCSSPGWSNGSGGDALGAAAGPGSPAVAGLPMHSPADLASSSGHSSEEGSSAAWRLCTWLQRQGWPAQHCASFRSGSSGGGGSGAGWRFTSGHEFVVVRPQQGSSSAGGSGCSSSEAASGMTDGGGGGPRGGGGGGSSSSSSGGSSEDMDCYADMPTCEECQPIVVDPEFSTQFALASPTPRYQVVLAVLPRVFVGTHERLHQLVEWVCREMQGSFQDSGNGLPPWRSLDHVLSKWRLHTAGGDASDSDAGGESGPGMQQEHHHHQQQQQQQEQQQEQQEPRQQYGWQAAAATDAGPASAPADCGTAFSVEQQAAMRSLLRQPAPELLASAPQRHTAAAAAVTASSSCSSMDTTPAPAGLAAGAAGAARPTTPRSLLTLELTELALAAGQGQEQDGASAMLAPAYMPGPAVWN